MEKNSVFLCHLGLAIMRTALRRTGGGFALSDGAKASGLDVWIGHRLTALEQLPPLAISFVACVFIGCLTEVVANNAAASVTLPILAQMVPAGSLPSISGLGSPRTTE